MAKRDPNTTARNKCIEVLKNELKTLLPMAMAESGKKTESSLNGYIGSKADDFIDLVFTRGIYGVLPVTGTYAFGPSAVVD